MSASGTPTTAVEEVSSAVASAAVEETIAPSDGAAATAEQAGEKQRPALGESGYPCVHSDSEFLFNCLIDFKVDRHHFETRSRPLDNQSVCQIAQGNLVDPLLATEPHRFAIG